ncbi:MAG: flagellar basal body-associated FliL family protein [Burkholderiales bacterium]
MAAQQEPAKASASAKPSKPAEPASAGKETPADAPKTKGKGGKRLWLIGTIVLLLAAAGGATPFLLGGASDNASAPSQPAVFVPLETFTVNLFPADGLQQYLQVNVSLKVVNQTIADAVKARMPEVRNRILLLLSSKRAAELLSVSGKQKLATDIAQGVREMVEPRKDSAPVAQASVELAAEPKADTAAPSAAAPSPSVEVLFTAFIIQ